MAYLATEKSESEPREFIEVVLEGPRELLAVLAGRGILVVLAAPPPGVPAESGVCVAERAGVVGVAEPPLPRPMLSEPRLPFTPREAAPTGKEGGRRGNVYNILNICEMKMPREQPLQATI